MDDNFKSYANYYDLLYSSKNYHDEVGYIDQLLNTFSDKKISSILNLGCGTGRHDYLLSKKGYDLTGVDISENMVSIAKRNYPDIAFIHEDIRRLNLNDCFDAVISLFHVANYQTQNSDLKAFFKTAARHLVVDGLFIFDFWYGPAVLTDRPTKRRKELENDVIRVERLAQPTIYPNTNIVDVHFDVHIQNKENLSSQHIRETHSMRYLFLPEIIDYAHEAGLELLEAFQWLTTKELSFKSWYGLVILKKMTNE